MCKQKHSVIKNRNELERDVNTGKNILSVNMFCIISGIKTERHRILLREATRAKDIQKLREEIASFNNAKIGPIREYYQAKSTLTVLEIRESTFSFKSWLNVNTQYADITYYLNLF